MARALTGPSICFSNMDLLFVEKKKKKITTIVLLLLYYFKLKVIHINFLKQ